MKYKTLLTAKAEIVSPNSDEFKAVASSLRDRYGFELKPQMDLLYLRSCLVSAGANAGINDNDDIFTREEAWAARHTPVLKPFNWQHQDKDILGVIYTVQARDLEGNVLDINDDNVPDRDFDLWTEAAIFRLIHEDRASEIEHRAKSGQLFVSMEAWFDDYGYGFCDNETNALSKIVARNQDTSFLDKHLRASGGAGKYRDPESGRDVRIGRVLRSITFGGCGLVDRPANKRSVIEAVEPMTSMAELDAERQIELFLQKLMDSEGSEEVTLMNTKANEGTPLEQITAAVDATLTKREQAAAEARAKQAMEARAAEAEHKVSDLEAKVAELTEARTAKEAEVEALNSQLTEYNAAVERLVQEATAGATSSTPPEIAAIDGASNGTAAFQAKLSWITKSLASLGARAARADELEAELAKAEAVVREQDVRALLGEHVSDEALEIFVGHAAKLDNDAYAAWRDEKELMVLEIQSKGAKMPPEMMDKEKKKKGKDMPADKGCANVFEALLAKRRSESGMASPDTPTDMGDLIGHPGGEGVKSGVSSQSLRTPRHKIAGSTAGNDPAEALDNVEEQGGVQLAGAQAGDEGAGVSPFKVLANLVADVEKEEEAEDRPGFDPVR